MEPPIGYGSTHRSIFPESQFATTAAPWFRGRLRQVQTGSMPLLVRLGRVSSRPIQPKSLSTSKPQGLVVYDLPDEMVPSSSRIRSSRSAKWNNSCRISAISVCRASCLPSRSLLIGVTSTKSDSSDEGGASVFLPIEGWKRRVVSQNVVNTPN
jgi:hypothetical protein